jgi:GNAT superfamily N-acetyltransferase
VRSRILPQGVVTRAYLPDDQAQMLELLAQTLPRWANATADPARLWRWKHLTSPFGPSSVRVAYDEEAGIVGTYAMMPWRLRRGHEIIRAARGADLVTHPSYRRRGIADALFSDLSAGMKRDGTSIAFHTPNALSVQLSPKHGRRFLGLVGPSIHVRHFTRLLARRARLRVGLAADRHVDSAHLTPIRTWLEHRNEVEDLVQQDSRVDRFRTERTLDFLRWRYGDHPYQTYYAFTLEDGGAFLGAVIFRVVSGATANGLAIQEVLLRRRDPRIAVALRKQLREVRNADFFSGSVSHDPLERAVLGSLDVFRLPRSGYLFTVGVFEPGYADAAKRSAWALTLGDLDGF